MLVSIIDIRPSLSACVSMLRNLANQTPVEIPCRIPYQKSEKENQQKVSGTKNKGLPWLKTKFQKGPQVAGVLDSLCL